LVVLSGRLPLVWEPSFTFNKENYIMARELKYTPKSEIAARMASRVKKSSPSQPKPKVEKMAAPEKPQAKPQAKKEDPNLKTHNLKK
jgi:hypothetical protein